MRFKIPLRSSRPLFLVSLSYEDASELPVSGIFELEISYLPIFVTLTSIVRLIIKAKQN